MNYVLKVKAWKLFVILFFFGATSIIIQIGKFSIGELTNLELVSIIRTIDLLIFSVWLLILGLRLNKIDNNPHKFNNLIFITSCIVFFCGYANLNLQVFQSSDQMTPIILGGLSVPLTLLGLGYIFYNLPVSLKSIELNQKVKFSNCVLDSFLFLVSVWGIGVWWLQPRINNVLETKHITNKK